MNVDGNHTSCSQCGKRIEEPLDTPAEKRMACPGCGSTARTFNVYVQDTLSPLLREKLGLKRKHPGHKKPVYESVSGDDLHRKSGQWNRITREIDRERKRYKEIIINPMAGEVILSIDEPLTDHTGRGLAKPKVERSEGNA